MKTILFVILDQWADWEAAYLSSALKRLGQNQYNVKTVSLTTDCVESIGGFRVLPDYDIQSAPTNYEALILIGGMTWRNETSKQIRPLVEKCLENGKVLGGICDASAFLGTVGALNHAYHTSNDLNDLKEWAGAAYSGEAKYIAKQAISDHNIVTANGTASLEFAREVLRTLKVAPDDQIIEWYHSHKLGYYNAPL